MCWPERITSLTVLADEEKARAKWRGPLRQCALAGWTSRVADDGTEWAGRIGGYGGADRVVVRSGQHR